MGRAIGSRWLQGGRRATDADVRRLICRIVGHARGVAHTDGLGAAWHTCPRCGAVTTALSRHGGQPWLGDRDPGPTRPEYRAIWLARRGRGVRISGDPKKLLTPEKNDWSLPKP
jgi:hypothetical protein